MIYVNNVSVYPSSITIKKGQFYNGAYAIVSPSNATCGCVEWSSDDIGVATVNWESGQIYGRSGGTARIYATATDGSGKRDYITVTVDDTVKITSIYTCPENMTLMVGDTETLSPIIYPSNATNKTLDWTTTNSSVASVSGGVVTAKAPGSAYIRATARDGSGKVGSTFVEVWGNVLVQSINVVPSSKTMNIGDSVILSANVTPSNATDSHVVWESTNTSVATVNAASGLVCAVGAGVTTIKAEAQDGSGVVGMATITVNARVPVTGITVCPETKTLNVGESTTLQATVYPYNATNKSVTWCSSNESVACVDYLTGYITAIKAGTATITATTADGGYTDTADITIYIDTVTIKKDGYFNKVVFKNSGKVWRCINNDMIYNEENSTNTTFLRRSNYNCYKNYDGATEVHDGPMIFEDDELRLLYAIDPYGVAFHVKSYAESLPGGMATSLEEKDRVFRVLFGREPKYYYRDMYGTIWYETDVNRNSDQIISESEAYFGMHPGNTYLRALISGIDFTRAIAELLLQGKNIQTTVLEKAIDIVGFTLKFSLLYFEGEHVVLAEEIISELEDMVEGGLLHVVELDNVFKVLSAFTSFIELIEALTDKPKYYLATMDYCITKTDYDISLEIASGETYKLTTIGENVIVE